MLRDNNTVDVSSQTRGRLRWLVEPMTPRMLTNLTILPLKIWMLLTSLPTQRKNMSSGGDVLLRLRRPMTTKQTLDLLLAGRVSK